MHEGIRSICRQAAGLQAAARHTTQGRVGPSGGSALLYSTAPVETSRRKRMCFGCQDVGAWGISDLGIKSTQIDSRPCPCLCLAHKTARQLAVVCHWRSPGRELLADHHRV
ncbi:uncharacterized protein PpBr36_06039 [Pyricularia pennisetigena]|uniref:uncharacterized protein n=1 Tax=Pyricularia pennisetigena TaxID=1578925 RepID=UPI0011506D78|nr:uncharacterized protein PpBr36_06039 [Pyricularia pennisetigena]TLS23321.1 hypothetical protein PpBr36_06039 [Pyricularia pennisetigena]